MSAARWLRANRGRAVAVIAAIALAGVMLASTRDAAGSGFLTWFREEGRGVATEGTLLLALFCVAIATIAGAYAQPSDRRLALAANILCKATLAAAVAFMLAFPSLPQFENKSLTARAVLFPVLAMATAAWWLLRRRPGPYPSLVDASWTLVLMMDVAGNDLHWYGNWEHWDDTAHFVASLPLMFVIISATLASARAARVTMPFALAAVVAFSIYGTLHNLWEIAEFLSDRVIGTELQPGGMAEATANNAAALGGSLVALAIAAAWHRAGVLQREFVDPLAAMIAPAE